jgi:hypothetical protein
VLAAPKNFRREIGFGIAVLRFLRRVASSHENPTLLK